VMLSELTAACVSDAATCFSYRMGRGGFEPP
jgi:hypothetical protein